MLSRGLRSVAAGAILLAALTFTGIRQTRAQDQPPDLQMLLDLDLFSSPANTGGPAGPAADGSMLDQIRALRQMGYLNANQDSGEPSLPSGPPPINIPPWLLNPLEGGQ